ncbi:MAG: hypoxanthine phosphoribosyltransferase [Acidobacteria bacterium]|nr:hypoxanthine phosphoribosyltransferase [Acidobacteriota bacterium]
MNQLKVIHRPDAIARRVRALGREISRDFRGQTLDVVGLLDNGFVFMADLVRALDLPVRTHFIRTVTQDTSDPTTGKPRKEIFYTPEIEAAGRNILLVDGVLRTGITTDFLLRRISLRRPRVVKTAVLLDKPVERRVLLEPDYYAFRLASNDIVIGYGLSWDGLHSNLPYLGKLVRTHRPARRRSARRQKARRRRK